MKTYSARTGFRNPDPIVRVADQSQDGKPVFRNLRQHTRHSPDGHSWGYGGSGPAQLALDLLWDVYGEEPAPALYQAFKTSVVSRWPQEDGWTVTEDSIRQWVEKAGGFVGVYSLGLNGVG